MHDGDEWQVFISQSPQTQVRSGKNTACAHDGEEFMNSTVFYPKIPIVPSGEDEEHSVIYAILLE